MGVKDLNSIVRNKPVANKDMPRFDTLIIDGSNLIITFILSAASELQRNAPKTSYDTINRDMLHQMKYIVEVAKNRGVEVLQEWLKRFSPNRMYFVMDPQKGVNYKLTTDMEISTFAREFLFNGIPSTAAEEPEEEPNENAQEIEFDLKTEEQEARKRASSKKQYLIEMYDKLKTDTDDTLATLYRQSFHFMEPCNAIALAKLISNLIFTEFDKLHPGLLHVIKAEDEADLVIKNIGEQSTKSFTRVEGDETITIQPKTIICSADTDYFILFSGNPNIYITGLHAYDKVFSPIEQWRLAFTIVYDDGTECQMISDAKIFDYVIRLAPLFGNDYNRQMVISAKKYENALAVFYPISTENTRSRRSGIGKLIAAERSRYGPGVISTHNFDRLIYDYMINHTKIDFKRYLYSVFVYKNYQHFGRYGEIVIEDKSTELILKMFDKWASRPDPEGKYTVVDLITAGKYHKLYAWNHTSPTFTDVKELPSDPAKLYECYESIDISDIPVRFINSAAVKKDTNCNPSMPGSELSGKVISSSVDDIILDELLNDLD